MRTRLSLRLLPLVGLCSASLLSATAGAQQTPSSAQEGEFSVQRFEAAPGSKNYFTVEGARMDSLWGFTAGVLFNYANKPFVVRSCKAETNCSEPNATNQRDVNVINDMFTVDVLASLVPLSFMQIGLRVPVMYVSGDGIDLNTGGPAAGGLKAFGVGDATLEGKFRFFGDPQKSAFVLGGAIDVSAPLGTLTAQNSYIGNSLPITAGGRLIFDGQFNKLSFAMNLRGQYRPAARLGTTELGPFEFRYGAAVGYQVSPIFKVFAEGFGGTKFSSLNGTNSLEVGGGAQITPLSLPLAFTIGGGGGVLQGVGVPLFRAIGGVSFVNEVGDEDGDGVNDKKDQCPTIPEDKDGFEDDDGCLDDDNDQDGVPDEKDQCKDKQETINGFQDEDGCPDILPDRDKDNIADSEDKCPDDAGKMRSKEFYGCPDVDEDGVMDKNDQCKDQPEDTDGFQDTDGCPEPDNDGDKILDEADECPDQPEIVNGFKDQDGCPDEAPDSDKDGIPDHLDKCPDKPETLNGVDDEDGCPDRGVSLVQVTDDDIKILQRVEFATGSDKIQGAVSFAVLNSVASVLNTRKQIFLVEVAGHTDNVGPADQNRTLSQKRADAVVKYLVGKGVDASRLVGKGYGPDKPIAENKDAKGRQKNRRVEFVILKSIKKQGSDVQTAPPPPP
ncbi:MAG: OmpA family protein [Polyangiaceae bacterium]|nr:OmpA family protein [Polyangiaceae bacterium]